MAIRLNAFAWNKTAKSKDKTPPAATIYSTTCSNNTKVVRNKKFLSPFPPSLPYFNRLHNPRDE